MSQPETARRILPAVLVLCCAGAFLGGAGYFALWSDNQPLSFVAVLVGLVALVAAMWLVWQLNPVDASVMPTLEPARPQLPPAPQRVVVEHVHTYRVDPFPEPRLSGPRRVPSTRGADVIELPPGR
jgi:hypothetical protein